MGREKYGEAKKKLMIQSIPRYTSNMVGASDIAWACMAASITGSLVFIDDATANRSSRMNCEVCRAVLSDQIQTALHGDKNLTAEATRAFPKTKKSDNVQCPSQSTQ